jgi:hypothetical protein
MVGLIVGFQKVTRMCLASILFHSSWLHDTLKPNHVFLVSSFVHRSEEMLKKKECTQITFPWNDSDNVFTGIPPHVSVMQELACIKEKQQRLIGEFVDEVSVVIGKLATDGGRMTEDGIRSIMLEFQHSFLKEFNNNNNTNITTLTAGDINDSEAGKIYAVHFYGGEIHRLPQNYRFPRCGVFDLWKQWWIGDSARKIPPLRILSAKDFKHLNKVGLDEEELHGRTGGHKASRRDARKTWHDLKFLMEFVHKKIVDRGAFEREINPESVDRMFKSVVGVFTSKERDSQMRWLTVLLAIRRRNQASG